MMNTYLNIWFLSFSSLWRFKKTKRQSFLCIFLFNICWFHGALRWNYCISTTGMVFDCKRVYNHNCVHLYVFSLVLLCGHVWECNCVDRPTSAPHSLHCCSRIPFIFHIFLSIIHRPDLSALLCEGLLLRCDISPVLTLTLSLFLFTSLFCFFLFG